MLWGSTPFLMIYDSRVKVTPQCEENLKRLPWLLL
jgi:hypothetical protein